MKKFLIFASLSGLVFSLIPTARLAAQQVANPPAADSTHLSVGVFGDYLRYEPHSPAANLVGVGARVGLNLSRRTAIEGEMAYDFAKNYTSTYSSGNNGGVNSNFVKIGVRPLTALFGPRFDIGSPHAHLFVTGKVGFVNWSTSNPERVSSATFSNAVSSVGGSGTNFAVYPGGGVEGYWGMFGLRAEVGDTIYMNNGAHNNLRATFGPEIRF